MTHAPVAVAKNSRSAVVPEIKARAILFDWGDTLMRNDLTQSGPMAQWPVVTALPDALETLQWARQIGPVCIASGAMDSDAIDIYAALARVGLATCIDHIFCLRELELPKTDPRFWQTISDTLKLPPDQIVMVGDSYETDVLAPQSAGLHAIWFNWHNQPPHPCLTISALREVPQILLES